MWTDFSLTNLTSAVPTTKYYYTYDEPEWWEDLTGLSDYIEQKIISFITIFISIFGFMGNGIVLWLLGFRIKRNSFTVLILNLAAADLGVLLSLAVFFAVSDSSLELIYVELIIFTYSTGQFLLTVISIDRCVCVLFPIWHRLHRPSRLSVIVCAVIWVLSFLLNGIHYVLFKTKILENNNHRVFYQFFVNTLLCVPLMIISTLTLFIKVYLKSQQHRRGKLLTAIFLTLLFFLLFAVPLNATYLIFTFSSDSNSSPMRYGLLCTSLNSSINPLIYFLVGRKKRGQPRESLKAMLQKILEEEEGYRGEAQPPDSNPVTMPPETPTRYNIIDAVVME
uniref:mas-related G-protein coupled receptor member H-like n=1 Tax=Euleptes europaea TaxID=460621 RepID=UPI00254072C6|nr:mas-related G-protein coupled receptor member H-like [Euleptes europaea]